jgi:L,D-transpeptidase catalytic domain
VAGWQLRPRLLRVWVTIWRRWPGVLWRLRRLAIRSSSAQEIGRRCAIEAAGGRGCQVLIVDRLRREMSLYECRKGSAILCRSYDVGIGRLDCRTPPGSFAIQTMLSGPVWHVPDNPVRYGARAGTAIAAGAPENRIRARWVGFSGGLGIHGTDGSRFGIGWSDGCVLMTVPDVVDLFERVSVGTSLIVR